MIIVDQTQPILLWNAPYLIVTDFVNADKVSVEVQEDSFDSEARLMEREALEQQLLPRVQDNSTILGDVSDVESIYSIQVRSTQIQAFS